MNEQIVENKELSLFTEVITALSRAISSRKIYKTDHPAMLEQSKAMMSHTIDYFKITEKESIFIGIYEQNFIFRGKRIFAKSHTGKNLIDIAERLHCGGFVIQKTLQITELSHFLDFIAKNYTTKDIDEARALLKKHTINTIHLATPYAYDPSEGIEAWQGTEEFSETAVNSSALKQMLYDAVLRNMHSAEFGQEIDIDRTRSVSEFMLKYMHKNSATVLGAVVYPKFENYTVNHSIRVSALAVYVASQMGWSIKNILAVASAALLHDVGKCTIPDEVLNKKGRLTKAEFATIQGHPKAGTEILVDQKREIGKYILTAAWGHHIRHDGRGYPTQQSWAMRYPVSSLLQICDVFEALTAVRPYKAPMSPEKAFTIMIKDKGAFYPELLASFIRIMGLYPPGTQVKLDDGRYAIVQRETDCIDRPELTVVMEKNGKILDKKNQETIDLTNKAYKKLAIDQLILSNKDMIL